MSDEPNLNEPEDGADKPVIPSWLPGPLRKMLTLPNDHPRKTVGVAMTLCLVCSIVVAGAAVALRPIQDANRAVDKKKNILAVAGLMEPGVDINQAFSQFEVRAVDLAAGTFTDAVEAETYEQRSAAGDPAQSVDLESDDDIASIGRRAKIATVYVLRDGENIKQLILPVHGYGLWSTLYGFLSLEGDLETVAGLRFYEHAETPGLGGEVDNPAWRAKWVGKKLYDEQSELQLEVIKGVVIPSRTEAIHQVDGLAGATLTSRGVTNLIRFWLGEQGFAPFLGKLRDGKA
ncbi:MAG: Na(+)-translocating NADH-quinone reductase subunit C [Pseudomonadota bacterium]